MPKIICVFSAISFALCACSIAGDAKPEANYVVNIGKNDTLYYHLLYTINTDNLVKIETLSEKQFKQNGGQFEVLLKKQAFPIEAPNCKSDIILRMPWVASQLGLSQKYLLYKNIIALIHNQKDAVTVTIELNPYVKPDKNGLLLTACNVYFRHANNQYIPHTLSIN
jgi:hypothetical protein